MNKKVTFLSPGSLVSSVSIYEARKPACKWGKIPDLSQFLTSNFEQFSFHGSYKNGKIRVWTYFALSSHLIVILVWWRILESKYFFLRTSNELFRLCLTCSVSNERIDVKSVRIPFWRCAFLCKALWPRGFYLSSPASLGMWWFQSEESHRFVCFLNFQEFSFCISLFLLLLHFFCSSWLKSLDVFWTPPSAFHGFWH